MSRDTNRSPRRTRRSRRKGASPADAAPIIAERSIHDGEVTFTVEVQRDRRLRKTARWTLYGERLVVRAPAHLGKAQIDALLDEIIPKVVKQRRRAMCQNDADLDQRAQEINRQYFDGNLNWHSIRWVSNMQKRLGSCTSGGSTDGDIRISEQIRYWPDYVVDYVIAHELAHRLHPNHSPAFWEYLARYPHTDRARGFIEGVAFAEQADADDWL